MHAACSQLHAPAYCLHVAFFFPCSCPPEAGLLSLASGPYIVRWPATPTPLPCDVPVRDLLPGSRMVVTFHMEDESDTVCWCDAPVFSCDKVVLTGPRTVAVFAGEWPGPAFPSLNDGGSHEVGTVQVRGFLPAALVN
jgi:hypothetical protein